MMCVMVALLLGASPVGDLTPGYYNATAEDFVGFRQLEIHPDGQVVFRSVITQHLPPVETATHLTRLRSKGKDRWCMVEPVRGIAPCVRVQGERRDQLVSELAQGGVVVFRLARKGGKAHGEPLPLKRPPSAKPVSAPPPPHP